MFILILFWLLFYHRCFYVWLGICEIYLAGNVLGQGKRFLLSRELHLRLIFLIVFFLCYIFGLLWFKLNRQIILSYETLLLRFCLLLRIRHTCQNSAFSNLRKLLQVLFLFSCRCRLFGLCLACLCKDHRILQIIPLLLFCLAIKDFLAKPFPPSFYAKGIPRFFKSSRASSSVFAVVTMVMSIPLTRSILS
jgi:hypothetical protein